MIDDPDEPLEGDIGPSARPSSPPPPTEAPTDSTDPAEELRRYEEEREARRRRTNAISGRVAAVLAALLLAFLAYDSIHTALEAHDKGDAWLYPPATIAAMCVAGLGALLAWALRSRRK